MFIFNQRINALRNIFGTTNNTSGANRSNRSLIDYSKPETQEIAARLRVGFEGIRREAENRAVQKAVKREFHHNIPALEEKVKEKLFPESYNSPKTIGIV